MFELNETQIVELSGMLNFTTDEIRAIIPYLFKHNPEMKNVKDISTEWDNSWYRNYDFEKDIVEYEYGYIADYQHGQPQIKTKDELRDYIIRNYVVSFETECNTNSWRIYKIHDKLWIEHI